MNGQVAPLPWTEQLAVPSITAEALAAQDAAQGEVAVFTTPAGKRRLAAALKVAEPQMLAWLMEMGRAFGPAEEVRVWGVEGIEGEQA